jgi:hypothetical protein
MKRLILTASVLILAALVVRCGSVAAHDPTTPAPVSTSQDVSHAAALQHPTLDPAVLNSAETSNPSSGIPPSTAGLPPENPQCVNHSGPGATCWGEWLKEPGTVDFTPVAKGALGAGPWPITESTMWGAAEGLSPPILYVGVDTAENVYAVSAGSLYIRRVGQATFEAYAQGTNGLKNYPFLSVAGQAPGVAFVGHVGITPPSEFNTPPTDPPALLQSGGIDKVVLTPTGISVTPYWTHNANSPSGSYSHDRTLYNLFVPRRGPAAGELYSSSEHCVTRRLDESHYASHRHIDVVYGGSEHYGMARAVTVTDDGYMWYGSDYEFGALQWQPRLYEWYFDNPWILPTNAFGTEEEQDWYRGIGVTSTGDVWAAANGFGLAHLSNVDLAKNAGDLETVSVPDANMNSLVVDTDDTIWVGADSGLYRYTPVTGTWTNYPAAGGGIAHVFLDDTVTPRAIYAATQGGVFVYRGM